MRKSYRKVLLDWIKKNDAAINMGLGSIAVVIISIVLSGMVPKSMLSETNAAKYNVLQNMREVDDIAHKRDSVLESLETGYNMEWDKIFHRADYNYHKAQLRDDKYKAAEVLMMLMKQQSELLTVINYEHTEDKNKLLELEKQINQIQAN